jgi:HPt (histidine-containing phosphotransfer) domain-containing protein
MTGPAGPPVPGSIDLNAAVARLGGNRVLYQKLYRMFSVDAGAMVSQLAPLVAAGRRQEARRVSHTLKGLGGTMGAVALARAAAQAEAALAREASDEDARLLVETATAFTQACCGIELALSSC